MKEETISIQYVPTEETATHNFSKLISVSLVETFRENLMEIDSTQSAEVGEIV